jgi:FkbM family methyltransferase
LTAQAARADASDMVHSLKNVVMRLLPERLVLLLKRHYYPRLLRDFPEARWPGSAVVRNLVRPGDTVIDAGANIGYVTRLLAGWTGAAGKVLSFEPVPATFELLAGNMRALGLAQVEPFHLALSSTRGSARMEIPEFSGGGRNYYESKIVQGDDAGVRIETDTLDHVLSDRPGPVAFIKIDVEGHELALVQGALTVLRRDKPSLYIEVNGDPRETGSATAELFNVLGALGYEPHTVKGAAVEPFDPARREADVLFLQPSHHERLRNRR